MRERVAGREVDESGRRCRGQERGCGKKKGNKKKKKEKDEERRGRKEGVRVRVRLGVGGAIRNYCGTIDKRRLRGCTTEDSLWPERLPFHRLASLSPCFSSLFPALLWTSATPRHTVPPVLLVPCPRNLPDSSICNA